MPELVAAAISWIVTGSTLAASTYLVWGYVAVIAASYAYGTYQSSQARRKAQSTFNASLKDRLVMTATTDAPRSRVYGRVRNVDGILYKASHGDKSQYYTFVVAVAGHEIDGFEAFWFNDQMLTLDGSGYVTTDPYASHKYENVNEIIPGSATSGSYTLSGTPVPGSLHVVDVLTEGSALIAAVSDSEGGFINYTGATGTGTVNASYQTDTFTSFARVRGYTGAPGQDLSGELIALGIPGITAGVHRFEGIACLLVTLTFSTDAFPQGVPTMSATIRGARCFDPRTNVTAWTENPAIIARDWATYVYGGAALPEEIDDTVLMASANACDVTHAFAIGQSPLPGHSFIPGRTSSQPIYTCGIVAPTQTDPTQTLQEIVQAMAGKYTWAGGRLRIRAGFYAAPVVTIDETWLHGNEPISVSSGVPRIDLVNIYRPTISDSANGYVVAPTQPVRADAYITLDGQELPRDLTLAAVTDTWHAQNVCGVMLRDMRQGLSLKLPCNMKAYPVEIFDTVAVSLPRYGWTGKTFEVLGWEFSATGGVSLQLKETDAVIYDPDAGFTLSDQSPNTNMPLPWFVPPPTGLTVSSGTVALTDGSILTRTKVEWDAYPLESIRDSGQIEVQYVRAHETPPDEAEDWPSVIEAGAATFSTIVGLQTGWVYIFRIRAINAIGVRSRWATSVAHRISEAPLVPGGTFQQETPPTSPGDGALWEVPSTGAIYRWNNEISTWVQFGGGVAPLDLTPPPTVTGLAAVGGFANIIVTWNAPTYTQGKGNKQTNIYAVKKASTDPTLPTFSSATRVAEAPGPITIITLPSDLSVRWHIWAKFETVAGVESVSPAGGTNGVVAQTGMIDGTDLAPLIIEARHLREATPGVFADQTFEGGNSTWAGTMVQRLPSTNPTVPTGAPYAFAAQFLGRDDVSFGVPVTVYPGEQYRLSLYVNRTGLGSEQAGVIAYLMSAAETVITPIVGAAPLSNYAWQRAEVSFTIPNGATHIYIGPWINQAFGGPLTAWFTGLLLEKKIDASLVTTNMIVAGSGAIGALAIENAMLGNAVVDDAKIANLSAAKLTVGDGTIGGQLRSANHVPFTAGWYLNPDGRIEGNNIYARGDIVASSITAAGLNSTINNGVVTSGARIEVTTKRIAVYDEANVLRVKLGDLS